VRRRQVAAALLAGVAAAAALAVASRATVRAGDKPAGDEAAVRRQLVGEWKLNPDLSEDPREKMRQAGGRGGGYGGPGGQGAPASGGKAPGPSMLFTASRISVTNLEPEVTMLDPEGAVRRLHANDKPYKDASSTEVKARWDEGRLVVETKGERGSTKETWMVGADPRHLTVLLEIKRPYGGAVSVKRVFDPVPAGSGVR
jgi:hypothetical protein